MAPLTLGAAATLLRSPYLPAADASWQRHAALERRWLEQGVRTSSLTDAIAAVAPYAADLATRWSNGRDAAARRARDDAARMGRPLARLACRGRLARYRARSTARNSRRAKRGRSCSCSLRRSARSRRVSAAGRRSRRCTQWRAKPCSSRRAAMRRSRSSACWKRAGLDFDALWVAGLSADRWPAAPRPNPLAADRLAARARRASCHRTARARVRPHAYRTIRAGRGRGRVQLGDRRRRSAAIAVGAGACLSAIAAAARA